jgi:hypothetical protein
LRSEPPLRGFFLASSSPGLTEDDVHNPHLDNVKLRLSIAVALLTLLTAVYYGAAWANGLYLDWHNDRYALKTDVLTMAQVAPMQQQLDETQKTANETQTAVAQISTQLEFMRRDAAITAANTTLSGFKEDLNRLEQNPENSRIWHSERARLNTSVSNATEYRNCLMISTEEACRGLRNW